jgi:hypothetical protein
VQKRIKYSGTDTAENEETNQNCTHILLLASPSSPQSEKFVPYITLLTIVVIGLRKPILDRSRQES